MIQSFKPRSGILSKYIELFYVFKSDKPGQISYIAFPHVNTAVSLFRNASIQRDNYEINITQPPPGIKNFAVEILGKYTQPVFVNFTGKFDEVAIIFKPLGVSHFFESSLSGIAPRFSQPLNHPLWTEFAVTLFQEPDFPERIDKVEAFLLSQLRHGDFEWLYRAISYLENFEANFSLEHIASQCGMSLKTFQRNFLKHMACPPSDYKRIARFRDSLKNKLVSEEIKTLTRLSHESNYYDQSYFIREFKKLTSLSPRKFFESISALDEKKIVWKIK